MKRAYAGIILLASLFFSMSLVSAQYPYIDDFMRQTGEAAASIFGPIFGHDVADEFLFAKILLFFLIFAIVSTALKNIDMFNERGSIRAVVAVIFAILSVRYLQPNELVTAILLPYGAFGAALTIFLPLIVYFYFVHTSVNNPFARRAAWCLYGAVFVVLWFMRPLNELGTAQWIYVLGFGFIFINVLFDRSVHSYFGLAALERWRERADYRYIAELQEEYQRINSVNAPQARIR